MGVEVAAPTAPERVRINARDLQTHGYTDGCPQCGHIQRYGRGRAGGIHNDTCRDRFLKAIGDTIIGRQRLDDYNERVNRAMAEQIERADAPRAIEDQRVAAPGSEPAASLPRGGGTPGSDRPRDDLADYQQRVMDEAKHQRQVRTAETPVPTVRGGMTDTDSNAADTANTGPSTNSSSIPSPSSNMPSERVATSDEQMDQPEPDNSDVTDMGYVGSLEPAIEPAIEPAVEPAIEPAIGPAIDLGIEPAIEPAIESAIESAIEPAIGPAIE